MTTNNIIHNTVVKVRIRARNYKLHAHSRSKLVGKQHFTMPKLSRFHTKTKRARDTRWCPYHASVDDESLEGKLMQEIEVLTKINTKNYSSCGN